MTNKLTELEVLPLKDPSSNRVTTVKVKGAVIIAAGIIFLAALVGIFA